MREKLKIHDGDTPGKTFEVKLEYPKPKVATMSDTEIRMMRYTIEQLSAELQATRQYVSDIKTELERTRKALGVAMDFIEKVRNNEDTHIFWIKVANDTIDKITALEQKD